MTQKITCKAGNHIAPPVGRCAHCEQSFCAAHEGSLDYVVPEKRVRGQYLSCSRADCVHAVNLMNKEHWEGVKRAHVERTRR